MRKFILVCLMIWLPVLVLGQRKLPPPLQGPPTKADEECAHKADQCSNNHKYNAKQRRAFYPFNKAYKIRLVSYESMRDPKPVIIDPPLSIETEPCELFTGVKPGEFAIDYSQIKEFKDISAKAIDEFTDIFFNVGFTPIKCNIYAADPGASCYEPRNAILFINRSGKTIAYMEFCFGCHRHYFSSYKIKSTEYCAQKYELLRKFFRTQGILFGTDKVR